MISGCCYSNAWIIEYASLCKNGAFSKGRNEKDAWCLPMPMREIRPRETRSEHGPPYYLHFLSAQKLLFFVFVTKITLMTIAEHATTFFWTVNPGTINPLYPPLIAPGPYQVVISECIHCSEEFFHRLLFGIEAEKLRDFLEEVLHLLEHFLKKCKHFHGFLQKFVKTSVKRNIFGKKFHRITSEAEINFWF